MRHKPTNCDCKHDEDAHYPDPTKFSLDSDVVWGCRECDNPVIENRCLAAGMDGYVVKPVAEPGMHRVLSQWLTDAPPIDGSTISVLHQTDDDLLVEVIDIYVSEAPERIASIGDALGKRDPQLLAAAVHALRSSSGNVGASPVREICAELEKIRRSGEMTGAAKPVEELVAENERAVRALGELHQA